MQSNNFKAILKHAARVLAILPFAAVAAFGQQTVNLTAAPTTTTLPDGTTVPMWGYFCGAAVTGSSATCAALNPTSVAAATWSPVVITVPTGQALTINLTNGLSFVPNGTPTGTAMTNTVPTSIVIVGQVGGGLGGGGTYTASPNHSFAQGCPTWFIAANPPGTPCTSNTPGPPPPPTPPIVEPPIQGKRVQSFGTEVAAGATASLTWTAPRAGTYLLESGTHPSIQVPMGLIGMLVVTTAPTGTTTATAGTAYPAAGTAPAVPYSAEVPLEFSEIDPVQNKAVDAAVRTAGFNEMNMKTFGDGVGSITVTSGGTGYSANPTVTITGGGGSGATASAAVGAVITGVTLSSGGSGYAAGTTVTLPAPGTGGTQATAVPNLRFGVGSVVAPAAGTGAGYGVNDVLYFNSGGGSGATATVSAVTATGAITAVTFSATTNAGTGYSTVPTISSVSGPQSVTSVALTGGAGYAASDTLTLTGGTTNAVVTVNTVSTTGAITGYTLTSGGAGYTTPPTVSSVSGPQSVTSVALVSGGSGYAVGNTVTLSGGTTNAVITVNTVSTTGAIIGFTLTSGGAGYTTPPTANTTNGTGTLASFTATLATGASFTATLATGAVLTTTLSTTGSISSITITNGGSFYATPVAASGVTFNGTGTGAVVSAVTTAGATGSVYAVSITNPGTGYSTAPSVTFSAGTAAATASLSQSCSTLGLSSVQASPSATGCYPSAVNYTPFYYLINGLAFNKNNAAASVFPATAGVNAIGISGTILARLVNAGLRMHVPSIVGSQTAGFTGAGVATTTTNPAGGFTLIAEDGNVVPGVVGYGAGTIPAPRVQTDVFMAAGKTFDVMVNVPATPAGALLPPSLPIYDRSLSLSGNSSNRDAGMLAYIGVNGSGLPVAQGAAGSVLAAAAAVDDFYNALAAGQVFRVTDTSKGVIANDTNVYGVTLLSGPASGTLTCEAQFQNTTQGMCANGTFTYTPTGTATSDTFTYCANGTVTGTTCSSGLTATVHLGATTITSVPSAINQSYTAHTSNYIKIASPGLLIGNTDSGGLPMTVVTSPAPTIASGPAGGNLVVDANGGFTMSFPANATTATFNYTVQNSQGRPSAAAGTVTVTFPAPSNLTVNVLDAQAYNNCNGDSTCIAGLTPITDYRWIIEEDKTFWVDPNCTTNSSINTPGCPTVVGPSGQSTIPTFGVNFHTSWMDYVAQGCTGALSCESGQTMYDNRPTVNGVANPTYGTHIPAVCDVGNGACRPDPNCAALPCFNTAGTGGIGGTTPVLPGSVHLDPSKRYYISVLPGDAGNPFPSYANPPDCSLGPVINTATGPALNTKCGHTMSGAPIPPACNVLLTGCNSNNTTATFAPVNVLVLPTPLPTGKLSVMVFEDDFPLNGEQDAGGGVGDNIAPNEPGLGGFEIILWDTFGGLGDVTGQNTHDMFNQPLSNALAGTIDPATGFDACPITTGPLTGPAGAGNASNSPPASAMTGRIVTCPNFESDGVTQSPLAGQALVANLMPEKFSVQAYPGADRIARGEEWLQTNTLDGQHPHDSFIRIGEPGYFQEYGPAGYHVSIGFANPKIINDRRDGVCKGSFGVVGLCNNTIDGFVNLQRQSRTPDQRLYPSGSRDGFAWTQCWVSLGDPDAEDFMFTKCDANGYFQFTGVPGGNWRLTIGDQWNDQIIDGLSTPANVGCVPATQGGACTGGLSALHLGNIGVQQWQSNVYTKVYIDDNKNGIPDPGEIGIPLVYTHVRYRDGHNSNVLTGDFSGVANFNETFPLFNWYVVEPDTTRYKRTGTHVVYDAGGPADGSTYCGPGNGARACGTSTAYNFLANTFEAVPLPTDLSVPGAVYCAKADCAAEAASFAAGTAIPSLSTPTAGTSTGRIDPPWVTTEGWSGMTSQGNWIEFGMAPYCAGTGTLSGQCGATAPATAAENGGIHGFVDYAATRPFDMASQMIEQPWEPYVPGVTINLYQEGFAADGVTPTLKMVDTTVTSSWDAWAQGFYPGGTAGSGTGAGQKPYMSCPGQGTAAAGSPNQDLFYFTLFDQPNYLDVYNFQHNGGTLHTLPYNSQYKCYDAMHIWNQIQPAPYDGAYQFPSSLGVDPITGRPLTTNGCLVSTANAPCPTNSTSNMPGTNCTICVPNPDLTDHYRSGTPMLPPGKYVVEVVMPPGYEVYKEEDKNLLIGDNFIAPVTQEFGGLGADIFIIPDQASIASMYDPSAAGYNPTNYQDPTTGMALKEELSGVPGFPGYQNPVWPCVGEQRVVPDYLSLFPRALEVAPFAGAVRPLCDRKEVTLGNQMNIRNNFFIYTSTHIASKYTGVITDDFTSEFDPFAPQFGEKFAPPNMPVTTKDYLGNEISRVYADHWGIYDGLTFSTWEVNPPNITGYSPSMMVQCMNDPGPIKDTNPASLTFGQMITDPRYDPAYSQFCYEEPYMPGLTTYLDTPVVPTQAFAGAGYNNADCNYPDTTPAIKEVDSQEDGVGPWVSVPGHHLTITALGDQQVTNYGYAGPSANLAPYNLKKVTRHYGFGTGATVTIGGVPQTCTGGDLSLTCTVSVSGTVNGGNVSVPSCPITQQGQYFGFAAQCGELVITAANGKQSVDSVTVTIGGKAPTHVAASQKIQDAIDAAMPGDLIIVDPTCTTTTSATTGGACSGTVGTTVVGTVQSTAPASHTEMVIMWKPVRLQGVGAASSIINANTHPAGKLLDPWRRKVNCLFGLTLQGVPTTTTSGPGSFDPTGIYSCGGWQNFNGLPNSPQIDRLPLEATVGWDATLNGNLGELLQEPSLMGAYEGAGITVLGKGLEFHGAFPWNDATEGAGFPAGTALLTGVGSDPTNLQVGDLNPLCHTVSNTGAAGGVAASPTNPYPSNFMCNPSSIDGLSVTNSSQGGGGIFVHGWAHHLQIANNRVYGNAGTLSGGISVGQGEFAPPYIQGGATNAPPGSCSDGTGFVTNQHLPMCLQLQVNVHNNFIAYNSSIGDELFSATLSGGGGATLCTGNDYYKFNYNWVCGNLSAGEGGGVVHLGEVQNGDIEHNSFLFNQSSNPTIPTNGGGIQVMGTPDTDPVCSSVPEADCPPGLSDGTGHNLVINANLIQGNSADSGSGGGIRLNQVNGTDVSTFPSDPTKWNSVSITNNIISNNIAGWDGAGISLQDALNVSIVNNTVAHNDSLATSGVLTNSLGAPQASAPPNGSCTMPNNAAGDTASCPQSAGVTSTHNSSLLTTTFVGPAASITCPGEPAGSHNCQIYSNPVLANNIIWQNRSFYAGISAAGTGTQNQQNVVTLYSAFTTTAAPAQTFTGDCGTGGSYWDIGVRGDTGPTNHTGGTLNPAYSVLSSGGYGGTNSGTAPPVVAQYCNGSRVPPECTPTNGGCGGPHGFGTPPGIADALTPNPVFSFTPSATVDEGNNWINVSWGPLSMTNPAVNSGAGSTGTGNYGSGPLLGNYNLTAAIDNIPGSVSHPVTDFFGNLRPEPNEPSNNGNFDPGAIEFGSFAGTTGFTVSPNSLGFGNQAIGTPSSPKTITVTNTGNETLSLTFTFGGSAAFAQGGAGTCGTPLAASASCSFNVVFTPPTTGNFIGSLAVAANSVTGPATGTGTPVGLNGTGVTGGRLTFSSATNGTLNSAGTTLTFTIPTPRAAVTSVVTIRNAGATSLQFSAETVVGNSNTLFTLATAAQGGPGTCSPTTLLSPGLTCTMRIVYATPTTRPTTANTGTATIANNGLGTTGGNSTLALSGQ